MSNDAYKFRPIEPFRELILTEGESAPSYRTKEKQHEVKPLSAVVNHASGTMGMSLEQLSKSFGEAPDNLIRLSVLKDRTIENYLGSQEEYIAEPFIADYSGTVQGVSEVSKEELKAAVDRMKEYSKKEVK